MQKINLAVIIGGKSPEHAISLRSGRSVVQYLDKTRYDITVLGIDKDGKWYLQDTNDFLVNADDNSLIALKPSDIRVFLDSDGKKCYVLNRKNNKKIIKIDVAFPVLHGAYGEDGIIQGLFRSVNVAFVGVDLMASAVGMDKDIAKRLWRDAGIPIAAFEVVDYSNKSKIRYESIVKKLGLPLFVKPANAGSSVGVHKVSNKDEFKAAIKDGFLYDRKLLIEEAITGIEVECAVLGNEFPESSVIGGIMPTQQFYSYDAKYISSTGAKLMIPAPISAETSKYIQSMAIKAFRCIGAEGLSRVDFFLKPDNSIVINEINTLPGFTNISMYPKLWEAAGTPYTDLLNKLIDLGLKRHKEIKKLKTTW
ncbi:MAG: D-alanine--D-alanine ligase [Saprospiraceae bacterium]|jgi:D-alanine-D-alanine ligase|nr:D-alanine--D-alanine ligase [Saprospiraceae bacterium]